MIEVNVREIVKTKDFVVRGMSYIGAPRSNTAMFITKKVEYLLSSLESVEECLVFAEEGIVVSEELLIKHAFVFTCEPQLSYASFANRFAKEQFECEKKLRYKLTTKGYFLCEGVEIPEDAYIEAGCKIGPDVKLGKRARILSGSVIKHTSTGDDFLSNEYAVIGANGFTMTEDNNGNKYRIPTLGKVVIGNNVEIGAHNNVSCGSGGNTIIEDYVKTDALVHIGHDVKLHRNVEITAGCIVGGFTNIEEKAYVGINAVLRNRISVGKNAIIGMGSNVTKSVDNDVTVVGNPARVFIKK